MIKPAVTDVAMIARTTRNRSSAMARTSAEEEARFNRRRWEFFLLSAGGYAERLRKSPWRNV
jgi:hypothetical protein